VVLLEFTGTRGKEMKKTRPGVVVSPDELNENLRTIIVAPMTTQGRDFPFRVPCRFQGKNGFVVPYQIRTIDHDRVVRRLGRVPPATLHRVISVLQEMFAP
jgi:mRNA interferase MazF